MKAYNYYAFGNTILAIVAFFIMLTLSKLGIRSHGTEEVIVIYFLYLFLTFVVNIVLLGLTGFKIFKLSKSQDFLNHKNFADETER
jgi:hypothetical protein